MNRSGKLGSYCWAQSPEPPVCIDAVGLLAPEEPLLVARDTIVAFEIEENAAPLELTLSVYRWEVDPQAQAAGARVIRVASEPILREQPGPGRNITYRIDLTPGQYAIRLFGFWPTGVPGERYDASYGFNLVVR